MFLFYELKLLYNRSSYSFVNSIPFNICRLNCSHTSLIHHHSLDSCLCLFSQLCYLHADLFRTLSAKETKKQFVEFCNTFLDKGAVSSTLLDVWLSIWKSRTDPKLGTQKGERELVF